MKKKTNLSHVSLAHEVLNYQYNTSKRWQTAAKQNRGQPGGFRLCLGRRGLESNVASPAKIRNFWWKNILDVA